MKRTQIYVVGTITLAAMLAGCGAGLYAPTAESLSKSLTSMGATTNAALESYPADARNALLDDRELTESLASTDAFATEWLCRPVARITFEGVLAQERQAAASALRTLSADSPTEFPALVAATLSPYAIRNYNRAEEPDAEGGATRAQRAANSAVETCRGDVSEQGYAEALREFNALSNPSAGEQTGLLGAAAGMWGSLRPILAGAMRFVDQERRAAEIRRFIRVNGPSLQEDLRGTRTFVATRNRFHRALAGRSFLLRFRQAHADRALSEAEQRDLHSAADLYDDVSRSSSDHAFDQVDLALSDMQRIARGNVRGAELNTAIQRLSATYGIFEDVEDQVDSLQEGGANHEKFMDAWRRVRGGS